MSRLNWIALRHGQFWRPILFELLLINIIPLCLLIGIGFVAGKWLEVNLHSLATIAIFILAPVVNFGAVVRIDFEPAYLLLPLGLFLISSAICVLTYYGGRFLFTDNTRNFAPMAASTGNTGYFGVPVVLAVLGPDALGIYLLMNFAVVLAENTVGYFYGARGHYGIRESFVKVFKLPVIYALLAGLAWNGLDMPLPNIFTTWWDRFTGAWVIIGMMLIGVALSKVEHYRINPKLIAVLFSAKFLLWPACTYAFALLDKAVLGFYGDDVHMMLLIIGTVPLAGNTVAYASQLNLRPGEAAMAVLASTLFAVAYIPLVFWILM